MVQPPCLSLRLKSVAGAVPVAAAGEGVVVVAVAVAVAVALAVAVACQLHRDSSPGLRPGILSLSVRFLKCNFLDEKK